MELILNRPDVYKLFYSEWNQKWAPAIVAYCGTLKKKEIVALISSHAKEKDPSGKLFNNNGVL